MKPLLSPGISRLGAARTVLKEEAIYTRACLKAVSDGVRDLAVLLGHLRSTDIG